MQSPDANHDDAATPRPPGRRKYRRWLVTLAMLLAATATVNGPGLRWIAPKLAARWAAHAGARVEFTLAGSLTSGLVVQDLRITGVPPLESLAIKRVTPAYQLKGLLHGQVEGIAIDGLHAELRLGEQPAASNVPGHPPLDWSKLAVSLRDVRARLLPLAIDMRNISLNATRDGKPVIALAPSRLSHVAGESSFPLALGAITDANGRKWPSQQSNIVWTTTDLSIDRIDPMPGVSVRDLVLRLPANGQPSAEAAIRIDDALLVATALPGFSAVSVDLREGSLRSDQAAARFGLKLPATAALTSLAIHVNNLLPDARAATGSARILLENIVMNDWSVPELSLAVELDNSNASLAAQGHILGSAFSLHAEEPVSRHGGEFLPGDLHGQIKVTQMDQFIAGLAAHTTRIDPSAVPPSTLDGDFNVAWHNLQPASADVCIALKPVDTLTASQVDIRAHWQPEHPMAAQLEIEGARATADYTAGDATYQANMECTNFASTRVDRWLRIFRADSGGALTLTGNWHGKGDLHAGRHDGALSLTQAEWQRSNLPPVTAEGGIAYSWPDEFTTTHLRIQSSQQTISGDATLAGGMLELTDLRWLDGSTEIAGGSASLPVPGDFSKWRAALVHDPRPLALTVESKVLPLVRLQDWLPAAAALDPRSDGSIQLTATGTYAHPEVAAVLECRNLRSQSQPKLPPADLRVTLTGRDDRLTVESMATTAGFPPAVMTASLPFRPAAWANDPTLLATEKITARIDLPRVDLARFSALTPAARTITGNLTGRIEVGGALGKPEAMGRLGLTAGGFEPRDTRHPAVTGIAASIDLTTTRVTLRNLQATAAGGTLRGGGTLTIDEGRPGVLDLRVTGSHLPVLRNDSLILRASADLRLAGPWDRATLAGTVDVVDGLFYRDIELLPIGTPFTTPSAAALPKIDAPANPAATLPEPFKNWNLNVLARTQSPFLIRGNFATGRIDGQVRVGGTFGHPTPDGEVRLSEFRAALPFSTLKVRSATARFTPAAGFDPQLEIRGVAEPRPYQVNLYVYGRASNPQLVLTSNPPLPDNEIMTLLATGTTTTGLENPQAASSRALQLLAEELRHGRLILGKRLRPLLALLDRVDFSLAEADPYSSESFSTATVALTDRWLVSAGMDAQGDSRVLAIWRISFH